MVAVVVSLRNPRSCDTITTVFSHRCKNSSSQVSACTSRWFVGSSRSNRSGFMNSACANEMRMRQPPENSFVALAWSLASNPSPPRMLPALATASSEEMWSSLSYTSLRSIPSCLSLSSSSMIRSSSNKYVRSSSVSRTVCSALRSDGAASCSTWMMCRCGGIGMVLSEMAWSSVDFPVPFRPTRPYLVPNTSLSVASDSSSCRPPYSCTLAICMSMLELAL
mmetsp:Transcript_9460/g.26374  ORF Transcript_9460/g.26374 Transcript_9460/m.26374 type:complete len:222 (-) Transcript_9460:203-868(-)